MAQAACVEGGGTGAKKASARRRSVRRTLASGCLVSLVILCAASGALAVALRAGTAVIGLPGGNTLKLGADDFVLSNYSFQNGKTYFVDLNGNGVRNILQVQTVEVSSNPSASGAHLEIVLHHAAKDEI